MDKDKYINDTAVEKDINQTVETLKKIIGKAEYEKFYNSLFEIIDKAEKEAFMRGYQYAITVLMDGLVQQKAKDLDNF
jgi:hypothetical protein